jgi:hypothetical protein
MKIQKKYQGAVPLNRIANEYNESEINTYSTDYINAQNTEQNNIITQQAEDISQNTTDISNLQKQVTHDYAVLGFSEAESSWTEDEVWVRVGFGRTVKLSGTKLSVDMPRVRVGAGVKKVHIHGQLIVYQSSADRYIFLGIRVNETVKAKTIHGLGQWMAISLDWVEEVKEGDVIDLAVYKDCEGERITLQDFVKFTDAPCNFLLVEVIE